MAPEQMEGRDIDAADALPDEYEVGSSGPASAEALATSVRGWIAPPVVTRSINAGS
jgi:hypothetical protein